MRRSILIVAILTSAVVVALVACADSKSTSQKVAAISPDSLIKRGEYLVTSIGCDDCHTPKKMGPQGPELDLDRRFSGHPSTEVLGKPDQSVFKNGYILFGMGLTTAVGPWGASYAANISSDTTGIGMWTEEQFFRAIRKGLSKGLEGNRPLLPPMPWFVYKNLNDDDLRSVFAYLKSTKPVKNVVPQPKGLKEL
ncbi:MAG TPA: diheme cytochrome c-553 [Chitinophagaceae bacterium]